MKKNIVLAVVFTAFQLGVQANSGIISKPSSPIKEVKTTMVVTENIVELVPIQTNESLSVNRNPETSFKVELLSQNGNVIMPEAIVNGNQLDVSKLSNGTYFAKICINKKIYMKKLLVKN